MGITCGTVTVGRLRWSSRCLAYGAFNRSKLGAILLHFIFTLALAGVEMKCMAQLPTNAVDFLSMRREIKDVNGLFVWPRTQHLIE